MSRFDCTYRKVQLSAKWHNSIITKLAMEEAIRHYNILEPNSWRCRHGNNLPEPDLSSASVEQILIALLLKVLVDQSMLCNQTGVDYYLQTSVSMAHVNKKNSDPGMISDYWRKYFPISCILGRSLNIYNFLKKRYANVPSVISYYSNHSTSNTHPRQPMY
jgi:hypothetical protein